MPAKSSIYPNPACEADVLRRYEDQLAGWPVPGERVITRTDLGQVHTLATGPRDAPVVLLLPAGAMSAGMWGSTAAALSGSFRVHAVDPLGDVGRSVLTDPNRYPRTGADLAAHYTQLADELGASTMHLVGNSIGGLTAAQIALHAPERVGRVAMICPMGLSGMSHLLPLMLWSTLPGRAASERRLRWVCRGDADVVRRLEPWMRAVNEVHSRLPDLVRLSAEVLSTMSRPTLVVLGEHDHIVGPVAKAEQRARQIPAARVVVLPVGHTPTLERPETVDPLILSFLQDDGPASTSA